MNLFFIQHSDRTITSSNCYIEENGILSVPFEVSDEDIQAVQEGIADWFMSDSTVSTIPSTRKADREKAEAEAKAITDAQTQAKADLKQKMTDGTATMAEIMEALSHIL